MLPQVQLSGVQYNTTTIQWFLDTFSIYNIYLTVLVLSHLKDYVDVGMDTFSADNALPLQDYRSFGRVDSLNPMI